jgi:hypothetical protein
LQTLLDLKWLKVGKNKTPNYLGKSKDESS